MCYKEGWGGGGVGETECQAPVLGLPPLKVLAMDLLTKNKNKTNNNKKEKKRGNIKFLFSGLRPFTQPLPQTPSIAIWPLPTNKSGNRGLEFLLTTNLLTRQLA